MITCQQGATIVDRAVIITPAENYQLPPEAHRQLSVRLFYILQHAQLLIVSSHIKF